MKLIKKTLKLLVFGIVLMFLSVGYRLLGDKNNNDTEGKNLINNAKADAPGGGCGGCGCGGSEGTGPSQGGSDGGSSGDGGGSSK